MTSPFKVTFQNTTELTWHFEVYLSPPDEVDAPVWQKRGVPPMGEVPSTASVDWKLDYGVAITDFEEDTEPGKTTGQQILAATPGKKYEVKLDEGVPFISPNPAIIRNSSSIQITNKTNREMKMGFSMDGHVFRAQEVAGGMSTSIDIEESPSYYIKAFRQGMELDPITLRFISGYTTATVKVVNNNGTYSIETPAFSH